MHFEASACCKHVVIGKKANIGGVCIHVQMATPFLVRVARSLFLSIVKSMSENTVASPDARCIVLTGREEKIPKTQPGT